MIDATARARIAALIARARMRKLRESLRQEPVDPEAYVERVLFDLAGAETP